MFIDPALLAVLVLVCAALGAASVGILVCVWALSRRCDAVERELEAKADSETDG